MIKRRIHEIVCLADVYKWSRYSAKKTKKQKTIGRVQPL